MKKALIAATNRGAGGHTFTGGGSAEGALLLKNHSGSTYTGWVSGTMPTQNTDAGFNPFVSDGTYLVGFGRSIGDADRIMVHVRIPAGGLAAGASLAFDLADFDPAAAPTMGTLADVPTVGGVALTLQTTTDDGPIRIYRYQGKLDTWFTATVWIYYAHGHNHHEVEMLITRSNNSNADLDFKDMPSIVLAVGAATITWTGTVPASGGTAAATGVLTASSILDGDTVYTNNRHYTFRDALSSGSHEVKRSGTLATDLATLRKAFNLTGVAGTDYSLDMTISEWLNCTASGATTCSFTARTANESGNWIDLAVLGETPGISTRMSWAGMSGGTGIAFGDGASQGYCGSLRYGAVAADIASAASRVDHPVELWAPAHTNFWPPDNRGPMVTATFDADNFRTSYLATLKSHIGTWNYSNLGPHPNSGVAGLQEPEGWSSCQEAFDLTQPNAGTIFVRKLAALEMARRQINNRESNGTLYTVFSHPNAVQFYGDPWSFDNADLLGKTTQRLAVHLVSGTVLPGIQTTRWHGADGQHFIIMTLPESYLLTGSLMLQELVKAWATTWMLSHHTNSAYPLTLDIDQFEPRSYGWISFAAHWIYCALDDRDYAELLAIAWRAKIDTTYARATLEETTTYGKPAVGIFTANGTVLSSHRWMFNNSHQLPGNYDPAGLRIDRYPGSYIENVSPDQGVILAWHHTIGVGGVYAAWRKMGGANGLWLARLMARNVVEHGWFLDGSTWRASNTYGINLSQQPTGNRFCDDSFNEWNVMAVSVFLKVEDSSHPLWTKAQAIYTQRLADLNTNAQVHKWIFP